MQDITVVHDARRTNVNKILGLVDVIVINARQKIRRLILVSGIRFPWQAVPGYKWFSPVKEENSWK